MPEKVITITVKGDRYGADIKEAIKTLKTRVEDFRSQAELCDAQRLGRMEKGVNNVNSLLSQIMKDQAILREERRALEEEKTTTDRDRDSDRTLRDLRQKVKQQELQITVLNKSYEFFTSNPAMDGRTGKGEFVHEFTGRHHARLFELTPTQSP